MRRHCMGQLVSRLTDKPSSLQVSEYVRERILALREQHSGQYGNVACLRTNAQKYLVNYFRKGQLTKLFFLFPVCFLPDALLG